jgi:hypothetical protein
MKNMKKNLTFLLAGALMNALCACFVACNDEQKETEQHLEESEVIGVLPISESDVPEEVSAFFGENPMIFSEFFDKFDKYDEFDNIIYAGPCFTINSMAEFRESTPSSAVLPDINFDKYTLVIGRYCITGGQYIKSHGVDTEPDIMKLNLGIGDAGNGLTAMFWPLYYGIYPKLPLKPIAIKLMQ